MALCLRCEDQSCSHSAPKATSLLLHLHPGGLGVRSELTLGLGLGVWGLKTIFLSGMPAQGREVVPAVLLTLNTGRGHLSVFWATCQVAGRPVSIRSRP